MVIVVKTSPDVIVVVINPIGAIVDVTPGAELVVVKLVDGIVGTTMIIVPEMVPDG